MNKICLLLILSISVTFSSFAQSTTSSPLFQLTKDKGYEMRSIVLPQSCESFSLDDSKSIAGLSLTGKIYLHSQKSFVRVILIDKDGNEYLALEMSRLFNDNDSLSLFIIAKKRRPFPIFVLPNSCFIQMTLLWIYHLLP